MFSRRRSKTDSLLAKALFALHDLLNSSGRHWIKGHFKQELPGPRGTIEMCYCIAGGVHELTQWNGPYPELAPEMFKLLADELESCFIDEDDPEGACISFNDDGETRWPHVETLIHGAIGQARRV